MNDDFQDVTTAELAVLQALWRSGTSTIRQLARSIYDDESAAAYGTVQKLLDRLEAKGHVRRERGTTHVFAASTARDELIGRRLRAVADTLCDGSLAPLLTHLVQADRLSSVERDELRALVERLDGERKSRINGRPRS